MALPPPFEEGFCQLAPGHLHDGLTQFNLGLRLGLRCTIEVGVWIGFESAYYVAVTTGARYIIGVDKRILGGCVQEWEEDWG